jgi:hypothetical protein
VYQLVESWTDLLLSDQLPAALDRGRDGVVELLAEVADEYLQSVCPAYAAVVTVCQTAGSAVDCEENRITLRNEVCEEGIRITGLMPLIDGLVRMWGELPSTIREFVYGALQTGAAFKDLWNDPSLANLYAFADTAITFVSEYAYNLLVDIWEGRITTSSMVEWASGLGSMAEDVVYGLLEDIGLKPVADILRAIGGPVTEAATALASATAESVDNILSAVRTGNPTAIATSVVAAGFTPITDTLGVGGGSMSCQTVEQCDAMINAFFQGVDKR